MDNHFIEFILKFLSALCTTQVLWNASIQMKSAFTLFNAALATLTGFLVIVGEVYHGICCRASSS